MVILNGCLAGLLILLVIAAFSLIIAEFFILISNARKTKARE